MLQCGHCKDFLSDLATIGSIKIRICVNCSNKALNAPDPKLIVLRQAVKAAIDKIKQ